MTQHRSTEVSHPVPIVLGSVIRLETAVLLATARVVNSRRDECEGYATGADPLAQPAEIDHPVLSHLLC